jgi:hypothetical protein
MRGCFLFGLFLSGKALFLSGDEISGFAATGVEECYNSGGLENEIKRNTPMRSMQGQK